MLKTVWRFQDGRKLNEGKENESIVYCWWWESSIDVGLYVEVAVPVYGLTR
jgi:hypothetical protein